MDKARIVVLEGTWWSDHEPPLVLPYFDALAKSHSEIDVSHRTFRQADDIAHYVRKIPAAAGVMLYFACHGSKHNLVPDGPETKIPPDRLLQALGEAKAGAVSFVHFGCCEMVASSARRASHTKVMAATRAIWASGYTKTVDWLPSTFLDLALITEIFVPQFGSDDGRVKRVKARAASFVASYEQLARQLGFSALSKVTGGAVLFPKRIR